MIVRCIDGANENPGRKLIRQFEDLIAETVVAGFLQAHILEFLEDPALARGEASRVAPIKDGAAAIT